MPETELQWQNGQEVAFRVDVLFATPETYEAREECAVRHAIRLQAKNNLEWDIQEVFTPPLRRPGHRPAVLYKGFPTKGELEQSCPSQNVTAPGRNSCRV